MAAKRSRPAANGAAEIDSQATDRRAQHTEADALSPVGVRTPSQLTLGQALALEGAADARAAANSDARKAVDRAIAELATSRTVPWSSDDVRDLLEAEGVDPSRQALSGGPNVLGAAFLKAIKAHLIRPVGITTSARPSRRGGIQRTYLGARVVDQ